MALFDRFREWITGLFRRTETDTEPTEEAPEDDSPRLDPDNVTEVRSNSEDDPVDKLQQIRQQQNKNGAEDEPRDGSSVNPNE